MTRHVISALRSSRFLLPAIAVGALCLAYVWLAPSLVDLARGFFDASPAPGQASARPQTLTFHVRVADRAAGTSPPVFELTEGDSATLIVESDRAGSLMVHGYPTLVEIAAGQQLGLRVVADQAGRFPVHLHMPDGGHIELAWLEIWPRK